MDSGHGGERGRGRIRHRRGRGRHAAAQQCHFENSSGPHPNQQFRPRGQRPTENRTHGFDTSQQGTSSDTLLFSYQRHCQDDGSVCMASGSMTVASSIEEPRKCKGNWNVKESDSSQERKADAAKNFGLGTGPRAVCSTVQEVTTSEQDAQDSEKWRDIERVTCFLPTYSQVMYGPVGFEATDIYGRALQALNEHLRSCFTRPVSLFLSLGEYRLTPSRGLGRCLNLLQKVPCGRMLLLKDNKNKSIYYGEAVKHNKEMLTVLYDSNLAVSKASRLEVVDSGMNDLFFWQLCTAFREFSAVGYMDVLSGNVNTVPASSIFLNQAQLNFGSLGHPGSQWPDTVAELDEWQYPALRSAITNALTVVHAPSGSGATHLITSIVRMLLDNLAVWNGRHQPALIVSEDDCPFTASIPDSEVFRLPKHYNFAAAETPDIVSAKRAVDEAKAKVGRAACAIIASEFRVLHQDELQGITESFSLKLGEHRNYVRQWLFYGMNPEELELVADSEMANHDAAVKRFGDILRCGMDKHNKFVLQTVQTGNSNRKDWLRKVHVENIYLWKKLPIALSEHSSHLASVKDIYHLDCKDRWLLYSCWVSRFRTYHQDQLRKAQEEVFCESRAYDNLLKQSQTTHVAGRPIIVASLSAAVEQRALLRSLLPQILIVVNAQRVRNMHVPGVVFPSIRQVVLFGDNLDVAQVTESLWHQVYYSGSTIGHYELCLQYVLPQTICRVLCACTVENMTSRAALQFSLRGAQEAVRFFNIKETEGAVIMLVRLAAHFLSHGHKRSDLAVLTLDSDRAVVSYVQSVLDAKGVNIRAASVHSWFPQRAYILLVYVGAQSKGKTFAATIGRSLCAVYAFGHVPTSDEEFQNLVNASKHVTLGPLTLECVRHPGRQLVVSCPQDFIEKFQDSGSCREACGKSMSCGHPCSLACHTGRHDQRCSKRVTVIRSCGHTETVACQDARGYASGNFLSGSCNIMVRVALPNCKHHAEFPCSSKDRDCLTYQCKEPVSTLRCGHQTSILCYQEETFMCQQRVTKTLRCGHSVVRTCCDTSMCMVEVEKELACGHMALLECWMATSDYWKSRKCNAMVRTKLTGCEHYADFPCSSVLVDRLTYQCKAHAVVLDCGHKADGPCYRRGQIQCQEIVQKCMPCGHTNERLCFDDSPCTRAVSRELDCGHTFWATCGQNVAGTKCSTIVAERLECGHVVSRRCSDSRSCLSRCSHNVRRCGHKCSLPCAHNSYGQNTKHTCRQCADSCRIS